MDERRMAAIAIAAMVEPGTAGVAELVAELGAIRALARLRTATRPGASPVVGRLEPDEVPAMVAQMARQGVRVVIPGDAEFPTQLLDLPEPPLALWVRGPLDLRACALRSVALVGARACTAYGERVAADLGSGLAQLGWAVVSGGAFGIDAAGHRAALSVCGPTVAVLACGVDVAYPRAHDALLTRIGDAGLLVSELPPGSLPLKFRFLARNRLIAALTRGTVVVEAARRSGAMATANRSMELGRELMVVPGPVTSMASAGTNRLLHERSARAVCDAEEVVSVLLGRQTERRDRGPETTGAEPTDDVSGGPVPDGPAGAVLAALSPRTSRSVEALAARSGVPPVDALAHLGILEITGLARRTGAGWRRCT